MNQVIDHLSKQRTHIIIETIYPAIGVQEISNGLKLLISTLPFDKLWEIRILWLDEGLLFTMIFFVLHWLHLLSEQTLGK